VNHMCFEVWEMDTSKMMKVSQDLLLHREELFLQCPPVLFYILCFFYTFL
jgi:hypothetical protein